MTPENSHTLKVTFWEKSLKAFICNDFLPFDAKNLMDGLEAYICNEMIFSFLWRGIRERGLKAAQSAKPGSVRRNGSSIAAGSLGHKISFYSDLYANSRDRPTEAEQRCYSLNQNIAHVLISPVYILMIYLQTICRSFLGNGRFSTI